MRRQRSVRSQERWVRFASAHFDHPVTFSITKAEAYNHRREDLDPYPVCQHRQPLAECLVNTLSSKLLCRIRPA
jgi:hypothetical protein